MITNRSAESAFSPASPAVALANLYDMRLVRLVIVLGAVFLGASLCRQHTQVWAFLSRNSSSSESKPPHLGTLEGEFQIGGGGGAQYRIPLKVPPGTAGMEPKLAITYDSTAPNGPLGMGWRLAGLSVIERCPASPVRDGYRGAIRYDKNDRFCLDGTRLISTGGAYGMDGTEYRTELETWQKVVSHGVAGSGPLKFTVRQKNGALLEYGPGIRASGKESFRDWPLTRATDPQGNFMTVEYLEDLAHGDYYPKEIRYTGNAKGGLEPARFVRFHYELRKDKVPVYNGGSGVTMARRMNRIETFVEDELVRRFHLSYDQGSRTGRSRLVSVAEEGRDGRLLTPTKLVSSDGGQHFDQPQISSIQGRRLEGAQLPMDFNGDGRIDLLFVSPGTKLGFILFLSNGQGGFSPAKGKDLVAPGQPGGGTSLPMDVNSDGRVDLVYALPQGKQLALRIFTSDGEKFFPPEGTAAPATGLLGGGILLPMEVNGDGRTDLVYALGEGYMLRLFVFLSNGESLKLVDPKPPATELPLGRFLVVDFDGDGLMDLLNATAKGTSLRLSLFRSNGHGGFHPNQELATGLSYEGQLIPLDINGDGKSDLVHARSENYQLGLTCFLSTGTEWTPANGVKQPVTPIPYSGLLMPSDVNGDGLMDLVAGAMVKGKLAAHALVSTGNAFHPPSPDLLAGTSIPWGGPLMPLDLNGDALTDLIYLTGEKDSLHVTSVQAGGPFPDLLQEITNGLGGKTQISYRPLTDPTVHVPAQPSSGLELAAASGVNRVSGAVYPFSATSAALPAAKTGTPPAVIDAVFPAYVVSRSSRTDGRGSTYQYEYTYTGGRIHLAGYGWLGFAHETENNSSLGKKTVTSYEQTFPRVGRVRSIRELDKAQKVLSEIRYTYQHAETVPKAFQVLATAEDEDVYAQGKYELTLSKRYAYDDYGNMVKRSDLGASAPGPMHPGIPLYHHFTYINDPQQWRFGFQTENRASSDPEGKTVLKHDKTIYNELTMTVRERMEWDSAQKGWLRRQYTYDAFGNVLTERNPAGGESSNTMDPSGTFVIRKLSPENSAGERLEESFTYDPGTGQRLSRTDANGVTTSYRLDGLGRLSAILGPDPQGRPVALSEIAWGSDENGIYQETRGLLDWQGTSWSRKREYMDGMGRAFRVANLRMDERKEVVVQRLFDAADRVTAESLPAFEGEPAEVVTRRYDPLGNMVELVEPLPEGKRVTKIVLSGGDTETVEVFTTSPGRSRSTRTVTTFAYFNGQQRPIRRIHANQSRTLYGYDALGRIVSVEGPGGQVNRVTYSSTDYRTGLFEPSTGLHSFSFDSISRQGDYAAPGGATARLEYDRLGRVLSKRLSDGSVVRYFYDERSMPYSQGRLSRVELPGPASYRYGYDPLGNLVLVDLRVGDSRFEWRTEHLPDGREARSLLPDGSIVIRQYNPAGLLERLSTVEKLGGPVEEHARFSEYGPHNRPQRVLFGNGVEARFSYFLQGQLRRASVRREGKVLLDRGYAWHSAEQIDRVEDLVPGGTESESFTYDEVDRLVRADGPYGLLSYVHDPAGNLIQKEGVRYFYEDHRVTRGLRLLDGKEVFRAEYDPQGNLRRKMTPSASFDYLSDPEGRLLEVRRDGSTVLQLTYDHTGRRLTKRNPVQGTTSYYVSEQYEVLEHSGSRQREHHSHLLGPMGVVASIVRPEAPENQSWKAANRHAFLAGRCSASTPSAVACLAWHRTAAWVVRPRTREDLAGALWGSTLAVSLLAWAATRTWASRRSEAGRRPWSRSPVLPLLVTTLIVPAEVLSANQGEGPSPRERGVAEIFYSHNDHRGSTVLITSQKGEVLSRFLYRPFGEIAKHAGPGLAGARFTGREMDAESGLYYFGARYYDPDVGRFMTPDEKVAGELHEANGFNRYQFSLGDPINRIDPDGHLPWWAWTLIGIGAVVAVTAVAVLAVAVTVATMGGAAVAFAGLANFFAAGAPFLANLLTLGWSLAALNYTFGSALIALGAGLPLVAIGAAGAAAPVAGVGIGLAAFGVTLAGIKLAALVGLTSLAIGAIAVGIMATVLGVMELAQKSQTAPGGTSRSYSDAAGASSRLQIVPPVGGLQGLPVSSPDPNRRWASADDRGTSRGDLTSPSSFTFGTAALNAESELLWHQQR